jgi:ABC-type dipeptide/oligopeptide/nickel transport system ATPase component
VAGICHRIAILHEGEIVECGAREQIFSNPQHEYTRRLMAALPQIPLSYGAALKKDAAAGAL